jgi:group I intron endonuclease
MLIGVIYIVRNILNGHAYVGQTYDWPGRRYQHNSSTVHDYNSLVDMKIEQYGRENFRWSVLYQGPVMDQSHLDRLENFFICEFRTGVWFKEGGYNIRQGGSHERHTERSKELIRQSLLGRKALPESIEKMRRARFGNTNVRGKSWHTDVVTGRRIYTCSAA